MDKKTATALAKSDMIIYLTSLRSLDWAEQDLAELMRSKAGKMAVSEARLALHNRRRLLAQDEKKIMRLVIAAYRKDLY